MRLRWRRSNSSGRPSDVGQDDLGGDLVRNLSGSSTAFAGQGRSAEKGLRNGAVMYIGSTYLKFLLERAVARAQPVDRSGCVVRLSSSCLWLSGMWEWSQSVYVKGFVVGSESSARRSDLVNPPSEPGFEAEDGVAELPELRMDLIHCASLTTCAKHG